MRYALLDLIACQSCHGPLTSVTIRERPSEMAQGLLPGASRVAPGDGVGPVPADVRQTPLAALLGRHARTATDPARNFTVEIEEGLLICADCGRWYPIIGQLPEILPDHLRNAERERTFLEAIAPAIPADLRAALHTSALPAGADDAGAHHKISEMTISSKIDDPGFFGPGYVSPFNPWNPEFTLYLIVLFGAVLKLLAIRKGECVLDSGCGYAWTTEWFHRAGIPAVGVDISRTYLDIGIERMGAGRPHLVVGDVEHLPLKTGAFDAVMAYESFHHIPNRPGAMASYDRILNATGRVVLAEPGAAHEHAEVSVDVMKKYGILERGMEIEDVAAYAAGTSLGGLEQNFLALGTQHDTGRPMDRAFLKERSIIEGNLFRLRKGGIASGMSQIGAPRRRLWPIAKRYIKRALLKLGLD